MIDADEWAETLERERFAQRLRALARRCERSFKIDPKADGWLGRVSDSERIEIECERRELVEAQDDFREILSGLRREREAATWMRSIGAVRDDDVSRVERTLLMLLAPKEPGKGDQGSDAIVALYRRPFVEILARLRFRAPIERRRLAVGFVEVPEPTTQTWWSIADLARFTIEACPDWGGPDQRTLEKRIGEWMDAWSVGSRRAESPTILMMPGRFVVG